MTDEMLRKYICKASASITAHHIHFTFKDVICQCTCYGEIQLEKLRNEVMSSWDTFYTREFHLEHNEIRVHEEKLAYLVAECQHTGGNSELNFLPFNDYRNEREYFKLEQIRSNYSEQPFGEDLFDCEEWKHHVSHAVQELINKCSCRN